MLIRTTVSPNILIKKGALEVNPDYDLNNLEDLNIAISVKVNNTSWAYIHLPSTIYKSSIDLVGYLTIHPDDALRFIPYSKDKEATKLTILRLYCLIDVIDSLQVIDLVYEEKGDDTYKRYKLKKVKVYDEYNYLHAYNIIKLIDPNSYIESIVLNLETKKLAQKIISKDGR